ncbi:uncharacterized protein [Palaemon carinicauda]|uniref:uncharacterized protein n=1 Tax=Palaemon carinicauda TaxID=392227 RepID=UPI0035B69167
MKLTLSIEGKKAVGLMDSGANCSLLSENWYLGNLKPKGVTLYNTSDYICDLSGNEINIIGHVVVDVEVSGMEQNSCVFYVKRAEKGRKGLGKNTDQECLVGMNVLSLLFEKWGVTKNVNVMASEKEGLKAEYGPVLDCCMRLVGQTMQVWQREDLGYASCLRQQNRNVPSGSRKLIKVYIDSLKEVPKEYVVLEKIADESKNMLPPGVQVLPSFSICEWGVGYVCVANWSKDNVSIEAGSILATVQLGIREFMEDDDNENTEKLSEIELQNHRRKLGVNVDESNLSKSNLLRLDKILYKYKDCFELNDSDLGLIKGWEHSIKLSCGKPIKLPYRRIAPTLIPEAKQLLDDLKKRGVIEESASPYAAPIVLTCVSYLGFSISNQGIGPDLSKIEAVKNWKRPETIKEVRAFLGFATFYRRFIKNFAIITKPLIELLKGEKKKSSQSIKDKWTEDAEMAFQTLIEKLIAAPVLKGIEFGKACTSEIDASYDGLGAVLSQYKEDKLHPVAYACRSLKPHERNMKNYSSRKLELCALKWAVTEKFKNYLIGTKCIVYTDNAPLSDLSTAKLDHTEQKWVADLSVFDIELKFRPGKQNIKADILSRKPREMVMNEDEEVWVAPHEDTNFVCAISRHQILEWEDVVNKQKACPVLKIIRKWLEGENIEVFAVFLVIREGTLYFNRELGVSGRHLQISRRRLVTSAMQNAKRSLGFG